MYLANWLLYTPENGFQGTIKHQGGLLKFSLHLKHSYRTVDYRSTMCVGTPMIRLRLIKSSLPFSLPLHPSCDKLFQALYLFSVLQATESWAGPGNEAVSQWYGMKMSITLSPSGMVWKCQQRISQWYGMKMSTTYLPVVWYESVSNVSSSCMVWKCQ